MTKKIHLLIGNFGIAINYYHLIFKAIPGAKTLYAKRLIFIWKVLQLISFWKQVKGTRKYPLAKSIELFRTDITEMNLWVNWIKRFIQKIWKLAPSVLERNRNRRHILGQFTYNFIRFGCFQVISFSWLAVTQRQEKEKKISTKLAGQRYRKFDAQEFSFISFLWFSYYLVNPVWFRLSTVPVAFNTLRLQNLSRTKTITVLY